MKRVVCVALAFLIACACSWGLPVRAGLRLGAMTCRAFGSDWELIKDGMQSMYEYYGYSVDVDDGLGTAFTGGLFLEVPAQGRLALQLELFYNQYSAPIRIENKYDSDDWVRWIERYRVVEVPVLARLRFGPQFSVLAGGVAAWRFGDLVEIIDGPHDDTETEKVDATGYADFLYGLVAGIEMRSPTDRPGEALFLLDIRYVRLLSPITDLDPPSDNDFFVGGVAVSIGIGLPVQGMK